MVMFRGDAPFWYEYGQSQRRNVMIGKGPYPSAVKYADQSHPPESFSTPDLAVPEPGKVLCVSNLLYVFSASLLSAGVRWDSASAVSKATTAAAAARAASGEADEEADAGAGRIHDRGGRRGRGGYFGRRGAGWRR